MKAKATKQAIAKQHETLAPGLRDAHERYEQGVTQLDRRSKWYNLTLGTAVLLAASVHTATGDYDRATIEVPLVAVFVSIANDRRKRQIEGMNEAHRHLLGISPGELATMFDLPAVTNDISAISSIEQGSLPPQLPSSEL